MNQFNSEVGFIILVALVVVGIILYAYITVLNQNRAAAAQGETKSISKYKVAASFSEFADLLRAGQPAEYPVALGELGQMRRKVIDLLTAAGTDPRQAKMLVDENLVAVCPKCHTRIASAKVDQLTAETCATEGCGTTVYALRWLGNPTDQPVFENFREL